MTDAEWGIAAIGLAGAVVGGFVGGSTPQITSWFLRPKLKIDFVRDPENQVTVQNGNGIADDIFVRPRVQNLGLRIAKVSQVFVTSVYEVRPDGTLHRVLKDSKIVQWAGGSKSPKDVPPRVEFYVDLLRISKGVEEWGMIFELFKDQQTLQTYSGIYRFNLLISADNATPHECSVNVEYRKDWKMLRAWQVKRANS